jgi:hypothetical protein
MLEGLARSARPGEGTTMKRAAPVATLAATGLLIMAAAGSASAADADGDNRKCVTGKEYRLVKVAELNDDGELVGGTPLGKVRAIFDSKGTSIGFPATYGWTSCPKGDGGISLRFEERSDGKLVAVSKAWAK